jgi:hypothetical protein
MLTYADVAGAFRCYAPLEDMLISRRNFVSPSHIIEYYRIWRFGTPINCDENERFVWHTICVTADTAGQRPYATSALDPRLLAYAALRAVLLTLFV